MYLLMTSVILSIIVGTFCVVTNITNIGDCKLLQDIKQTSIYFDYKLFNNLVSHSQCGKDLGVLLDLKLYFHQHIDYIFHNV
jgi:hypothetical protein